MDPISSKECSQDIHTFPSIKDLGKNVSTEKTPLLGMKATDGIIGQFHRYMVPLKLFYFFWYGGCAVIDTFFILYFKSLGLTVTDLSIIYIINPILQCSFPIFAGLIADKIRSTKPILFLAFILLLIIVNCGLFIPTLNSPIENNQDLDIYCERILIPDIKKNSPLNCLVVCPDSSTEEPILVSCFTGKKPLPSNDLLSEDIRSTIRAYYQPNQIYGNVSIGENSFTFPSSTADLLPNCEAKCQWSSYNEIDDNFMIVFVLSLVVIIGYNTATSIIYRIIDSSAMIIVTSGKSDFGYIRAFGMVSMTIFAPVTGIAIDLTTPAGGSRNYSMAFYIFDAMAVISIISIFKIDIHLTGPANQMLRKMGLLLKDLDTVAFFLVVLTLGTSNGFTRIFTPLFLEELHAPTMVFSMLTAVLGAVGLPFLVTSNWWIRNFGTANIFLLAFAGHVCMCVGMSFLTNPWWSVLYETLTIFTYHLLWVAVVRHSYDIAPEGLTATVIAAAGGIHFGMGRGTGSLIGGLTMDKYGARWAYRLIAIFTAVIGVLYAIFLYCRPRYTTYRHDEKEKLIRGNNFNTLDRNESQ